MCDSEIIIRVYICAPSIEQWRNESKITERQATKRRNKETTVRPTTPLNQAIRLANGYILSIVVRHARQRHRHHPSLANFTQFCPSVLFVGVSKSSNTTYRGRSVRIEFAVSSRAPVALRCRVFSVRKSTVIITSSSDTQFFIVIIQSVSSSWFLCEGIVGTNFSQVSSCWIRELCVFVKTCKVIHYLLIEKVCSKFVCPWTWWLGGQICRP